MPAAPQDIAAYLGKKLARSADEVEVARYGLQMVVLSAANLAAALLAGRLLGCLADTLAALLTAGALRSFSGGAHSGSPLRCLLFGTLAAAAFGEISRLAAPLLPPAAPPVLIAAGLALALPVLLRRAPVDSPAKPITSPRHRRNLRRLSLAAALAAALLQVLLWRGQRVDLVLAVECGLLWQVFSLTAAGHRALARLDRLLRINLTGGGEKR